MPGFATTEWSVVVAAGDENTSVAQKAIATLYGTYWYPLYAYARRRGHPAEDARDVVQGFFVSLLERRDFARLERERGRFRAFLLASLKHFLANDFARRRALKRGGGTDVRALSFDDAEERYVREPADPMTPEMLYERRWALTVIDQVLVTLRMEWRQQGREPLFEELRECLLGTRPRGGYAATAARLAMSEGAVKTAVHRLRRRFQAELHGKVIATLCEPDDADDEIRSLIRALHT
jgi:RNA polymerase sigma factor (sigma-70 family)